MSRSSTTSRTVVIDASLTIWAVLPIVASVDTIDLLDAWRSEGVRLAAPMLWLAECASAIRGIVASNYISDDDGRQALLDVISLEVEIEPMTTDAMISAYEWATRIGQRRAYDGFYLALAEELDAEYWTADQRLVNSLRRMQVPWIFSVQQSQSP